MEDHGEMPIEDFTHGLYRNVQHMKWAIYTLVALEVIRAFS